MKRRTTLAAKQEKHPKSNKSPTQHNVRRKRTPNFTYSAKWSKTPDKPHVLIIGKHWLKVWRTAEEIKSDKQFHKIIRNRPIESQVFRFLERLRNTAGERVQRSNQDVDRLKRELFEAYAEMLWRKGTLESAKNCLAVLSQDHETDLRAKDYTVHRKNAHKSGRKHYASPSCWMCGAPILLDESHPKRFFCNNYCAKEATRRRSKVIRLTTRGEPEAQPHKSPCPFCECLLTNEVFTRVSLPHHQRPNEEKRVKREERVWEKVYGSQPSNPAEAQEKPTLPDLLEVERIRRWADKRYVQ